MPTTITNNIFTLRLNEKGYYELEVKDKVEINIAEIELIKAAQKEVSGKRLPTLVSGSLFSTTNIETLKYISKNVNMPYSKASAFILSSVPQKVLGNFYLKFYKPERPTKFFNSKEEALEWIAQFI
ncbi:MAG: hypothetical protein V4565_11925 [Bacteroidota bacterium]